MFAKAFKEKRVLVTGHTGFKGAWLVEWLLSLGAEVAGYSIDIPTEPSLFKILGHERRIRHSLGDIGDLAKLQRVFSDFQPQIVLHLAAQSLVRTSYREPRATFMTNAMGTVHVLECLRDQPGVQAAVLVATDKCYENVEWEWGYRESDPLGGKDPYSASKAAAEIAFHSYARSFFAETGKPRIASARAGNVIGGGDWAADRIVPDCIRAWSREEVPLIRNPKSTRPWQHVLEPLSGYLWLAAELLTSPKVGAPPVAGESFNFGPNSKATQSVEALIAEMQKSWVRCKWKQDPAGSGSMREATLLQLNCDRAYARLGWESVLGFEHSVAWTTKWYRDFYSTPNAAQGSVLLELTQKQIQEYGSLARERGLRWAV